MNTSEISLESLSGGQSANIALTTASAQGPVVTLPTNHPPGGVPVKCNFTPDVDCFYRKGVNPTALSDGTDQQVLAGNTYRTELMVGERLAFIVVAGTGNVKFTQGA